MSITVPMSTDSAEARAAAKRAAYISGMRKYLDLLEAHPELDLPFEGVQIELLVTPSRRKEPAEQAEIFARLIPGRVDKQPSANGAYMYLLASIDGLKLRMILNRADVCERVVVGTREITTKAPDPAALAALPVVEQTVTEEIVEWRCLPILGGGSNAEE